MVNDADGRDMVRCGTDDIAVPKVMTKREDLV